MMLTSMVLRDYLRLKVEIEGTSGEGSSAVKQMKPRIMGLLEPFMATLSSLHTEGGDVPNTESENDSQKLLMHLYSAPEKQPGLYAYAKALECIESGLQGGFYYKHYCLAANVIGSSAKGTMNKAVHMLEVTYEKSLFPDLDAVRAQLGKKIDSELRHNKGKIMDVIEQNYLEKERRNSSGGGDGEDEFFDAAHDVPPAGGSGCPFGFGGGGEGRGSSSSVANLSLLRPGSPLALRPGSDGDAKEDFKEGGGGVGGGETAFDAIRRSLYSTQNVPPVFTQAYVSEMGGKTNRVAFLDHAWGKTPPSAHVAATKRQ